MNPYLIGKTRSSTATASTARRAFRRGGAESTSASTQFSDLSFRAGGFEAKSWYTVEVKKKDSDNVGRANPLHGSSSPVK